jgi:hypothetical protein
MFIKVSLNHPFFDSNIEEKTLEILFYKKEKEKKQKKNRKMNYVSTITFHFGNRFNCVLV